MDGVVDAVLAETDSDISDTSDSESGSMTMKVMMQMSKSLNFFIYCRTRVYEQ